MARKDERGIVIPAPLQFNNPASASQPRYDDEHRGPAVSDSYELSHCRIDLAERSEGWPTPANLPPRMVEFAQSVPQDQRADWLRRQANIEEADRHISNAMRSGELPIWVAPIGEPERLVAPGAIVEVDHATVVSGVYRPPNDRGWLYGRPLFVKHDDWAKFSARVDAAKKLAGKSGKVQFRSTGGGERQWLRLSKAVRVLHRILRTRLAGQEPAPWLDPPADPFDAECGNATYRHRRTARTSLTMRRALAAGDLTVHLLDDDRSHPIPGWAWENANAAENAFNFNWLPLNPLLDYGLQKYGDWRCFVSRAEFKAWIAEPEVAEIGDLPMLPPSFDHDSQPDELSRLEPPNKPFIELTQALTWIAFAVSLSRNEFSFMESCRFGPFASSGWPDALRAAMGNFADHASSGKIKVRGRKVSSYSDHSAAARANTEYLSDTQLRDFACFDSLYGGLERGVGLAWETDAIERALEGVADGWREVEVCRAELLAQFPAPAKAVPIGIAVGELSLPDETFDPTTPAEISPWWTTLQAIAWVATRSAAYVEHVGHIEAHNDREIAQFICSSMVLVYVSRNACTCSAESLSSTARWESCTCFRDAGRLILEQIRQGKLRPIQSSGGVSRTMAFHEFAGVGQRPTGADWHDLEPAPIFSSGEVIEAFPLKVQMEREARGKVPPNRQLDHDAIRRRASELLAAQPDLKIGPAAASIVAELGPNPKTGKPRDNRGIERLIARLWSGGQV